jgi:hypothetical protein
MHFSHCVCSPKTGITLFINKRSYNHLELPIVICTVIVVDNNIAKRWQHFRAASLLPQIMSANNGPRGGVTRHSVVPSPVPLHCNNFLDPSSFGVAPPMATAVVGGLHCSIIIISLSRTVAVIVLVLFLPPKRMPIPDHETPLRATYNNNIGPASIHASGLSLLVAWH